MWFRRKTSKADTRARDRKTSAPKSSASQPMATSLQHVRLPVDLVERGMRIVKLDRPWTEVPVLFQGFVVHDDDQTRLLRQYCDWVVVEAEETQLAAVMDKVASFRQRTSEPLTESRTLAEELPRAKETYQQTQAFVEKVTRTIAQGNDLHLSEARPIIHACMESIKANASAMFWMSRIKSRDAYTAEHCLRVAIFSIAFARFLGMRDDDLEIVGMCGLLHDLGKLQVPIEILNKPGALTPDEMRIMQQHTDFGYRLLATDQGLEPVIADVTRHHHERIDGHGYPEQLEEWQISRFARLVSIVDAFDAITSDRCYRDGLPASDAMRILYSNRGQQFDAEMIEAFIRMMGIYPPGSLVELSTGEVALVVSSHPGKKLKPKVEILLDADKQEKSPCIIDLADDPMDGNGKPYAITKPLADGAYGVSLAGRIDQLMADSANQTGA